MMIANTNTSMEISSIQNSNALVNAGWFASLPDALVADNEDDGGLSVQVDDIDGVEDSNVEEETDTDDKDMFGTSSLVTVHDEQHTTMRKRSSHATKHKK